MWHDAKKLPLYLNCVVGTGESAELSLCAEWGAWMASAVTEAKTIRETQHPLALPFKPAVYSQFLPSGAASTYYTRRVGVTVRLSAFAYYTCGGGGGGGGGNSG